MESKQIKFLLVTANVGSLFEEYGDALKKNWIQEFHKLVSLQSPTFIGLHLQEVGGKTQEICKDEVQAFFEALHKPESFKDFISIHGYIDEEHCETKYTALGSLYFIHKSISGLLEMWSFAEDSFHILPETRTLHSMSEKSCYVRKLKFPLSCFSKSVTRWPRKGFTWTRWRLNNKVFDMLNIHLTHDASNIKAALKSPTKYSKHRRRSLQFALDRLLEMPSDHQILYGDFNVRPDTKALIEHLMDNVANKHTEEDTNGEPVSLVYKSTNGSTKDLLTIGTRYFEFSTYEAFRHENVPQLISFDKELDWTLADKFQEMPITFQPTYPHKEEPDHKGDYSFAHVRCPSWCDRVILDKGLYSRSIGMTTNAIYDSYGEGVQLGDHKPVYLLFHYPLG